MLSEQALYQPSHLPSPSPFPTVTAPALGNCCMDIIRKTGTKREVFFRAGLLLLAFLKTLLLLYECLPACMYIYHMHAHEDQRVLNPPELELWMVVNHNVSDRS